MKDDIMHTIIKSAIAIASVQFTFSRCSFAIKAENKGRAEGAADIEDY